MPSYDPPLRDMQFVLHEVLGVSSCRDVPRFAELGPELVDAILAEAGRFARDVAAPLNRSGDEQGCTWDDGAVRTPDGFREAYRQYADGGWQGLCASPAHGGQGLPGVLRMPVTEMLTSANWGFSSYPGLTTHAMTPIEKFGAGPLQSLYLPKMAAGCWSATMNLTEPHCGTDLGLLRTRAVPAGDGGYRLTGTKIFITAGEHDLTENIVHLVLARIEGAPAGPRGISLFLVPKFLPDAAGNPGARNGVRCARIEHKMGIHSSSTCELVYQDAVGWLVGEPNRGLAAMFVMMNEARIGAGLQGVAIAEVAYQNAVAYARTRLQGRAPGAPANPTGPADPIIVHPDVRRMLLTIRAFAEGARALCYWCGLQADFAEQHPDQAARRRAEDLLDALTPVVKACLTDQGVESASLAIQCLGGHGYVREWGLEQFLRDARIAPIYEGTNGVQAMDLVGRKLFLHGGRCMDTLFDVVSEFCADAGPDASVAELLPQLERLLAETREATRHLQSRVPGEPALAGAVAYDYMSLVGLLAMGYTWARMYRVARARLAAGAAEEAFYAAKLSTARFFFARFLPMAGVHLARIHSGAGPVMELPGERL